VAGPGNILIKVGADAGQAVSELGKVNSALGDSMTKSQKMGAGLRKAALPAAAALTAIGVAAVGAAKAAAEDAAEQEHLAGVMERTAGATKAQIAATEDWISKTAMATGVADSELRPALEKIVTATGDVTKSQEMMGAALDIAAASGKSVDTVSTAIAKGYTGQTAALEKMIPGLSEAAKKSDDMNVIMAELATKTGGAAAESASTAAGQFKIFQLQMAELQETLGAALLPVIDAMLPLLQSLGELAADNAGAIQVLVGIVAGLAGAILIANAAMKAYAAAQLIVKAATATWTAAQWLLNAALTANPIGLVIVAVAALGAALVVAYLKSQTFRNIVQAALNAVKVAIDAVGKAFGVLLGAATTAFNWITGHWKVALFALGPIGIAISLIASNFDKVKSAAQTAARIVDAAWQVGKFAFGAVASAVGAIAGAFNSIKDAVYGAIGAVSNLIGMLSRIKVPHINLPGPFMLPSPAGMPAPGAATRGVAGATAVAPGGVTINISGSLDPEGTARAIRRILDAHDRRQGRVFG
jgi:hypothetical protein